MKNSDSSRGSAQVFQIKKQTNKQTHPVIQLLHFIKIGLVSEVTKKKHEDLEKLKYRKPLCQSK